MEKQLSPPLKWIRIEKGYNGNHQKWKLGDRIFTATRARYGAYKWHFYELPNIYSGYEIYTDVGDFREVLKRFKLFIQPKVK